jgi:tRNA 2-thiocytidine biosynthesis protein TtcA
MGTIPHNPSPETALASRPGDPERLAYWLLKPVNRAIREHHMIAAGERVAVAVSGGKDSLALLRLLDWRRRNTLEFYEIVAIHIAADARGPETPPHPPLEHWLQEQGYVHRCVALELPSDERLPMDCQRCTRQRRQALFRMATEMGCRVVAFGHHADDLAQTTLMNLVYHGRAETMAPVRDYFAGRLRLIRPLCYVSEPELRRFASASRFPPPPQACPQSPLSRRELGRSLLAQAQRANPEARINLLRAGLRHLAG